ncbi:MAG: acyl-CoA dehydrogenase [Myxococcales bacterium]|nr:acyl-CoA dehydrogenase [Myxococcales bacterium]
MTDADYVLACRRFAREVIAPRVAELDQAGVFPAEVHALAEQAGLRHAGLPVALGGGGVSHRGLVAGGVPMAEVCAPTAFSLGFNHGTLRPLVRAGRVDQVVALVREGTLVSWCMTEPDVSGSNLLGVRTRADRVPGGWRVDGHKCMVGNGTAAGLYLVLAQAFDDEEPLGPTLLVVPRGEGVDVGENTKKLGFRCLPTPEIHFRSVFVPADAVLSVPGGGLPLLLDSLDYMRLGGGIVTVGMTRGALGDLLAWLREREVYGGRRLVDESHVQVTVGRLLGRLRAVEHLLGAVADALDAGRAATDDAAALKLLGADLALDTTDAAVQLMGWRGIDARWPAEKRSRDARQAAIYEGTSEVQAMNLFRAWSRELQG